MIKAVLLVLILSGLSFAATKEHEGVAKGKTDKPVAGPVIFIPLTATKVKVIANIGPALVNDPNVQLRIELWAEMSPSVYERMYATGYLPGREICDPKVDTKCGLPPEFTVSAKRIAGKNIKIQVVPCRRGKNGIIDPGSCKTMDIGAQAEVTQ